MSNLIKNARILTADSDFHGDIFMQGATIQCQGVNLNAKADQTIDATGKVVFSGGIDPYAHLQMPFMGTWSSDNYETGELLAGYSIEDVGDVWIICSSLETENGTSKVSPGELQESSLF